MIQRLKIVFYKIVEFVDRLPIVRSIPGFNTLPEKITPYNLRFYKLCNLVLSLGLFVHFSWLFVFLYLGAYKILIVNAISVSVYIIAIIINRRGHHLTSVMFMLTEIILFQIVAVQYFGWPSNFQSYLMVIGLFPFLMPRGEWVIKTFLFATSFGTYLLLDYLFSDKAGSFMISHSMATLFRISNEFFSLAGLAFSGAYFNIAMHETEKKLEQKSLELVASEKKATLGKLATEMAHEIQNPLNFVNNFSEINEDLLTELKEHISANPANTDVKEIVDTLIENSNKISTNGKRVSKIVTALQEQVNKNT